jgi:hypothetical protein
MACLFYNQKNRCKSIKNLISNLTHRMNKAYFAKGILFSLYILLNEEYLVETRADRYANFNLVGDLAWVVDYFDAMKL